MALPEKKAVTDFASDGRPLVIGEPRPVRSANQKAWYALLGLGLAVYVGFLGWLSSPMLKSWWNTNEREFFPNSRIFTTVTPAYLTSLYKDNMTLQADKLFSDYAGKWMQLSGTLSDVATTDDFSGTVFVSVDDPSSELWSMFFDASWRDRLSIIPKGDLISAECQIEKGNEWSAMFQHCKLIS